MTEDILEVLQHFSVPILFVGVLDTLEKDLLKNKGHVNAMTKGSSFYFNQRTDYFSTSLQLNKYSS
jgi:hypothetical protein